MFRYSAILIFFCIPFSLLASKLNRDSLQQKIYITSQPAEKIKLLNLLSESWLDDDPIKSYHLAKEALSLAESVDDMEGRAESLYNLAVYSYKQNDYITAGNLLIQSQEIFRETENSYGFAKASLQLGKVYLREFEYEKSLEVLLGASGIFQNLQQYDKLAETYNSIGGIYFDQLNYDKAFEYFQNSLLTWSKISNGQGLAIAYNNLGEIYRLTGKLDNAMEYYRKSVPINKSINRLDNLVYNYDNIANIFIDLGQYDSASYYLKEALRLCNSIGNEYVATFVYLSFGKLYRQTKYFDLSLKYFDSCYQLAGKTGAFYNIKDATFGISEIYKERGQFEQAYNYHRIYKNIGDSLINIKNLEKITQIEMKLIFEHENKLKAQKLENARTLYLVIAFSLLSFLIIAILFYGRLRIKNKHSKIEKENLRLESQQLTKELNFKNRELAVNVIYLVKKNELINFISEKLLRAKSRFKTENQVMIQQLIIDLQASIDSNIWKTFEQRFLEVHKEFYEKLKNNYPDLSESDRKLCALLRLNMSTKDIAAITHQNPNSIEVARTRLRKKLQLSNKSISLVTFLESY